MPNNFKDEDVRVQKTNAALMEAMSELLGFRNFNKITVNDLCMEAQISRTTFYSHFIDKYDLLKYWLTQTTSEIVDRNAEYKNTKKRINNFVNNSRKTIRHLIEDANPETLGLICDFMLSLLDMNTTDNDEIDPKYFVLSKFYCGGIINYLEWQVTNKSKIDSKVMNSYFFDILDALYKWNKEHK